MLEILIDFKRFNWLSLHNQILHHKLGRDEKNDNEWM